MEAVAVTVTPASGTRERTATGNSELLRYKFRRGAQRTVQHVDQMQLKEGQRVFKALHANEYVGPAVPHFSEQQVTASQPPQEESGEPKEHNKESEPKDKEGVPFFIGSGGEVFDVYYRKCDDEVTRRIKGGSDDGGTGVFRPFPQPEEYETYFDYEQALLNWKSEADAALGDLHLPDIVGRYYARPTVAAPIQELVEAYDENALSELRIEQTARKDETDDELSEEPLSERRLSLGQNPRAIIRESDTWDANLLPPEPQPEFYKTFEEFEQALLRWAELCNSNLPYIPPHASQLEQLIPIQSQATADQARAARQSRDDRNNRLSSYEPSTLSAQGDQAAGKPRTGLCYTGFFAGESVSVEQVRAKAREQLNPANNDSSRPVEKIDVPEPDGPEWQECHEALDSWVQQLLLNRISTHKEYGSFNKPMLPVIHGTFPTHYKTPRPPGGYKPSPLRRTDLTEQMLEDCYDCPEGINGKKVEFSTPLVNIEPLNMAKLHGNEYRTGVFSPFVHALAPSALGMTKQGDRMLLLSGDTSVENVGEAYRVAKLRELRREQCRNRWDQLNGWYNPMLPQQLHETAKSKVRALLRTIHDGANTIDLGHIVAILQIPVYLDHFQDLLSEHVDHMRPSKGSGLPHTLGEYMVKSITPNNIEQLLMHSRTHANNPLFLAKLSLLVQDLISGKKGKALVDALTSSGSLKSLSYLAYAMTFFNEEPVDIYPYDTELIQHILVACQSITLLGSFLDPAVEAVINSVFTHYYLNMLTATTQSKAFAFFSLGSSFLGQQGEGAVRKLQETLKGKPQCLQQFIGFLGHRSARISSFFLFITLRLMHIATRFPAIKEHLVALDIVDKMRELARSRFSHVQYGAKLIFALLQTAPWAGIFGEKYGRDPEKGPFMLDLANPPRQEYGPQSLLSSLLLDSCLQSLLRLAKDDTIEPDELPCNFLWKDAYYFEALFTQLVSSDCSHQIPTTVETCSVLLARLSQAFARLKLIEITSSAKKEATSGKKTLFTFTEAKAKQLLTFISSVAPNHPLEYAVKTNVLIVLRNLVKAEGAFPTILTINDFFAKLVVFCKDTNYFAFNRAAWATMFTCIQRHTGVLEYLLEKNTFNNLFDIISVVSGNIISQNSIRYITKMFNLHGAETTRVDAEREPKRHGDKCIQSVEKDVRLLCKYFSERKMFIKFQMLSKRYIDNADPSLNYPGAAFVELVRLYKVINDSSSCDRLKRDIFKNSEYQQSFQSLIDKYGGVDDRDSGLHGTVIIGNTSNTRMPTSPGKDPSRSGEGLPKATDPAGKKPKTPKTPRKSAASPFSKTPEPAASKKENSDSPKRKWFGIMKKSKDKNSES